MNQQHRKMMANQEKPVQAAIMQFLAHLNKTIQPMRYCLNNETTSYSQEQILKALKINRKVHMGQWFVVITKPLQQTSL